MKKLMVAVAAVAFGLMANAATVNWNASGIPAQGTDETPKNYVVYLFDTAAVSSTDIAAKLATGDLDLLSKAIGSKKATSKGAVSLGTGSVGYTTEQTFNAYGVIFNNATAADATYFAISPTVTSDKVAASGSVNVALGDCSKVSYAQIAPEPTSGLLLLLGVAGLALRRRRA